jgi:cardiolipin synthase
MPRPESGEPDRDRSPNFRRVLEALTGEPMTARNRVEVLRNGDEIFPAMLAAIRHAERSVDLLTFIYWAGEIGRTFAEELRRAAERGVRVRVLLDAIGARSMSDELIDRMVDGGCDVRWFRPVELGELGAVNHRTHRKVLVCDEVTGFTGGVGIADEWTGDARDEHEWRDTHFQLAGPAVAGLRAAFIDNWIETGDDLFDPSVDLFPPLESGGSTGVQVISGAAETGYSDIATLFRVLPELAVERLRITTAYFSPDDAVLGQLIAAADRGVQVEILLPGPHADKRFVQLASEGVYGELLSHGVELWNFQPSMLHAKVMTVDGLVSTIGSSNFNSRSTQHDEEVNLVVYDAGLTAVLDEHFDHDLTRSVRIDPSRWDDRGTVQREGEAAMRAVNDLL